MKIKLHKSDIVYIDMDGVLVEKKELNFEAEKRKKGFFLSKSPIIDAVSSFKYLATKCDIYILSTPVWSNPNSWTEKRLWVEKHLGEAATKKLILSHNKSLCNGKYLIDDTFENGADNFSGCHIHFGGKIYPDWQSILMNINFLD